MKTRKMALVLIRKNTVRACLCARLFFACFIFLTSIFQAAVPFVTFGIAMGAESPLEKPDANEPGVEIRNKERTVNKDGTSIFFQETLIKKDHNVGTGYALFLGLEAGPLTAVSEVADFIKDKTGYTLGGAVIASVYPENWVFDLGLGWFYSSLKGEERLIDPKTGLYDTNFTPVTIITHAALAEPAIRFRITPALQFGPSVKILFGEDLSFSSEAKPAAAVFLAGGGLFYGMPKRTGDLRFGISAFTDINVAEKRLLWVAAAIQFGMPFLQPNEVYSERNLLKQQQKVETRSVERTVTRVVTKEVVKFVIPYEVLSFPEGRSLLGSLNQRLMIDLGTTIKSVDDTWEEITVEGHVLRTAQPSEELNQKLSLLRAAAVRNAIVSIGVPSPLASVRGWGSRQPLESRNVESRNNERIELSFAGVSNAGKLNDALNAFVKKYRKPETCDTKGCK